MAGFVPDLATGLAGALSVAASGSQAAGSTPRVPMLFSSRLRSLTSDVAAALRQGQSAAVVGQQLFDQASRLIGPGFQPVIAMAINPKTIKFSQPKRYTKKDTRDGSVFFHFTNSRGQNNDIATLTCTGNTGNIDLRGSLGNYQPAPIGSGLDGDTGSTPDRSGPDTGALAKLLAWHNLYVLTREPMLLGDGTVNDFTVTFSSKLFPVPLTLHGFFSRVLEFEENAQKPNSREYSFEFMVTSSEPDLDEFLQVLGGVLATPPGAANVDNIEAGDQSSRRVPTGTPDAGTIPSGGAT